MPTKTLQYVYSNITGPLNFLLLHKLLNESNETGTKSDEIDLIFVCGVP